VVNGPEWAERFFAKVDRSGPVPAHRPELGACHVWTASLDKRGYGQFNIRPRMRKAHQVALELAGIEIPAGHEPDHLCRNRACVRPDHLEPVTRRENFLRGEHSAAVTVRTNICQSGRHEFTPENTITKNRPDGRVNRECRACDNEGQRRRRTATK
jgi:hypothetical protein